MQPEAFLKVSGLCAGYGHTPILQGADFSVGKGEIVAVIGRNGVGKTTLMKCLMGLLPSSAGSVTYQNRDITALRPNERARRGIGYIPQGRGLFPQMTVAENLAVGELIGQRTKTKLYDLIFEFFPILAERKSQQAGTMSGGQQQMLSIARALVGGPKLVLLDEPSEGIQPSIVQQISKNMVEISRRLGITVILVEQNISMIRSMAQRCYVMNKGTVVDEATIAQLEDPEMVRRFLSV
jgi:urea transport system ATP-binding protein